MKADKYTKIASYTLYALFAIILVVVAMFFCVGETQEFVMLGEDGQAQAKPLAYPQHTDALIYLCYALSVLSVVLALVFAVASFVKNLIDDAKAAVKGLVSSLLFVVACVAVFVLSESTVDAIIYLQYILLAVCIVCAIFGMIGYQRPIGK